MKTNPSFVFMFMAVFVIFFGCATIVGQPTHLLPIKSNPGDATVLITDETGAQIFKGTTPTSATLQKSTGKYWGKKAYKVTITKSGFKPQTISIEASANGWYIAGNFVFGGLIGWFLVDPFSGNMYNLAPENVSVDLAAETSQNNNPTDGRIVVMSTLDVPPELLTKLQRIY